MDDVGVDRLAGCGCGGGDDAASAASGGDAISVGGTEGCDASDA